MGILTTLHRKMLRSEILMLLNWRRRRLCPSLVKLVFLSIPGLHLDSTSCLILPSKESRMSIAMPTHTYLSLSSIHRHSNYGTVNQ